MPQNDQKVKKYIIQYHPQKKKKNKKNKKIKKKKNKKKEIKKERKKKERYNNEIFSIIFAKSNVYNKNSSGPLTMNLSVLS